MDHVHLLREEVQRSRPTQTGVANSGPASSATFVEIRDEPDDSGNDVQLVYQPVSYQEFPNANGVNHAQAYQPSPQTSNGYQSAHSQREEMGHFLQNLGEENEAHRSRLTHTLEDYLARMFSCVKDGASHLFSQQLTNKVIQLQGKLQATIQEKQGLEAQNQQLSSQNAVLKKNVNDLNERLAKALSERDEQRRLADGATLANKAKTSDDAIQRKWKQLDYNIRSLANYLSQFSPENRLDEAVKRRLRLLTPSWHKFLWDNEFSELLIQGYLWCMVDGEIFDGGSGAWGGGNSGYLKVMRDNIWNGIPGPEYTNPSLKQVARWVNQGTVFLEQIWGRNERVVRTLLATETRRLRSLMATNKGDLDRIDTRTNDELRGIIEVALELDLMLMNSKAVFRLRWRDVFQKSLLPSHFRSEVMEAIAWDKSPSPKSRIEFFMSPILYKYGNADGQNYDSCMVVCKASVVCD